MLLTLPACHIPGLRPADAGAALPAGFNTPAGPPVTSSAEEAPTTCPTPPPVPTFYADPALVALICQAVAGNLELKVLNEEVQIAANEAARSSP